ncbi:hypothetical protein L3Q82_004308 [Scortum barcoo]|uniref:Uncharacterized protein n=1 Tax=Scortum barcoo TaxID=214431 RepID=A0ACB8VJX5_9TELE|nr:hypothetical protein L3Q82_004308 [Scortum barcoo]
MHPGRLPRRCSGVSHREEGPRETQDTLERLCLSAGLGTLGSPESWRKCLGYTFFIVLYPMGVTGELLTIYAALPNVQKTGLYSVTLPNKYNFSFDYYTFLILVMISYIPPRRRGGPQEANLVEWPPLRGQR